MIAPLAGCFFGISVASIFYLVIRATMRGPHASKGRLKLSIYESITFSLGVMLISGGALVGDVLLTDVEGKWISSLISLVGLLVVVRYGLAKICERQYAAVTIRHDVDSGLIHVAPLDLAARIPAGSLSRIEYSDLKNDRVLAKQALVKVDRAAGPDSVAFAVQGNPPTNKAGKDRVVKLELGLCSLYAILDVSVSMARPSEPRG
jgi:hypothetical protein